jgi:hypothetical protein
VLFQIQDADSEISANVLVIAPFASELAMSWAAGGGEIGGLNGEEEEEALGHVWIRGGGHENTNLMCVLWEKRWCEEIGRMSTMRSHGKRRRRLGGRVEILRRRGVMVYY